MAEYCPDSGNFEVEETEFDPEKQVAVFGASSFLGAHLIQALLKKGYRVNAVIKHANEEQHTFLWELKNAGHHLKLFEVDLLDSSPTTRHALDEAVKGCGIVFHGAFRSYWSDFGNEEEMEKRLVTETLNATLHILQACVRSFTVGQLIQFSTADAIFATPRDDQVLPMGHPHFVFTSADWADPIKLRERGAKGYHILGMMQAERLSLDYMHKYGGGISFSTLCTGQVMGGLIECQTRMDSFLRDEVLPMMSGSAKYVPRGLVPLAHITDVCHAAMFIMEKDLSGRFLCMQECIEWAALADIFRQVLPECGEFEVSHSPRHPGNVKHLASNVPTTVDPKGEDPLRIKFTCDRLTNQGYQFKFGVTQMVRDFAGSVLEMGLVGDGDVKLMCKGMTETVDVDTSILA